MSSNQSHRYISKAHLTHSRVGFYFKNMFGALKRKAEKIKALNQDEMLTEILNDDVLQAQIVELNKKQMTEGKGADGEYLPRYVDDPYFKTIQAAENYMNWKSRISPNPEKPIEVMDLYIDGTFHSTVNMENSNEGFRMTSTSNIGGDIQDKTGRKALGLSPDSIKEILPGIKDSLRESIIKKTT